MLSEDKNQLLAIYLVKTAGKILGPFTEIEIIENIQRQEIGALDEIRTPHHRWTYLRDHLQFNEIWRESLKGTRITKSGTANQTFSILQKTQNIELEKSENKNEEVSEKTSEVSSGIVKVEIPKLDPAYKFEKEIEPPHSHKKMIVIVLLSLFMLGVAAYTHYTLKGKEIEDSYNELLRLTRKFKALDLNYKALTYYKQAIQFKEPDIELQNQMAYVLMAEERQTFQARSVFEIYLSTVQIERKKVIETYNGIGLSYLIDDDYKLAEENFLKALSFDSEFIPANINLAYLYFKKESYEDAFKIFSKIKLEGEYQAAVLFGKLLTLIEGAKTKKEFFSGDGLKERVASTLLQVKDYQLKHQYLASELWLLKTYLMYIAEMHSEMQASIYHWDQMNFDISKFYSKELQIDHKFENWEHLEKYCNEFLSKIVKNDITLSIRAVCYIKNQKFDEAKKKIDESYAINPLSVHSISANLIYTSELKMDSEFSALSKKEESKKLYQKAVLNIQKCLESKNISCVDENLEILKEFDSNNVFYLNSYAKNSFYKGEFAETLNYLKLSEDIESKFKPNIELKLLIEERNK